MQVSQDELFQRAAYPKNTFITRTKTSIRYAKENHREKRERKKGRRGDIEREGEIRERGERDRESERARKILVKSSKPINKAQTKVDYTKLCCDNYEQKLLQEIMRRNYYRKL